MVFFVTYCCPRYEYIGEGLEVLENLSEIYESQIYQTYSIGYSEFITNPDDCGLSEPIIISARINGDDEFISDPSA